MKSHIIALLYAVITCSSTDGRQFLDPQNGSQHHVYSDAFNESKVNVTQDSRHQPEYYGYEIPCPDAEDIDPCVCTYTSEDNAMDLDCSAVESEDQLKQIFKAYFPVKKFVSFSMYENSNIKVLEAGVFNGISFERIEIQFSHLEVIELQALDSCYETAWNIDVCCNMITSFPFDELSHFPKLRYFDIRSNSLSMIPADAFNGLTALETLSLDHNDANIVGTFKDLPNLREINLANNDFSLTNNTIPTNYINTGSSDLSYIYLYNNNIVSVEPGAFDIVEGLVIYMYVNALSTLEEATWRPYLEAQGYLSASDNPLVCGCDIAWLFGEDQLLEQVDEYATCTDGERLIDLDPKIFDLC
ncbi:unnamed protein product [Meganyctiphanes norvegica]|uniref:Oplophorus-luciferin 2-monooxygenase non-catalytic subunit n=1 Tax=Meganyctiphanes norvegica TaxID=48144 RepID=A0AAV2Q208_MEGNR